MDTYAYDNHLPCKNPHCKSHGTPHPNCKCYGGAMAEGGNVEHFCSSERAHNEDCEYFADGGMALPSFEQTVDVPAAPAQPVAEQTSALPAFEDTHEVQLPSFEDTVPTKQDEYGTTGQQILTGVEGLAQGVAGPIATGLELGAHKLGLDKAIGIDTSAEAQAARQEVNPGIHAATEVAGFAGSLALGVGEARVLAAAGKGAQALAGLEGASAAAKVGAGIVRGAVEAGLYQGGNEITQAMLGQSDPETPVASALMHIGAAGLFGGVGGGVFGGASAGLNKLGQMKAGTKMESFLAGVGVASHGGKMLNPMALSPIEKEVDSAAYKAGLAFYNEGLENAVGSIGRFGTDLVGGTVGGAVASHAGLNPYAGYAAGAAVADKILGDAAQEFLGKTISSAAKKTVIPVMLKTMSTGESVGLDSMFQALDYANNAAMGAQRLNSALDQLFRAGSTQVIDAAVSEKKRNKIKKYIENGGITSEIQNEMHREGIETQAFAEGGQVQNQFSQSAQPAQPMSGPSLLDQTKGIATFFPAQDMLINSAKGRVSDYLNSVKPQEPIGQLPFSRPPSSKDVERSYNRAIDVAAEPLSILAHVNNGTLTTDMVTHLKGMYPEVHNYISKKVAEKMVEAQMKGTTPSYKVRQGLSKLLGAPVDSSMLPQNIQAAQAVFAQDDGGAQQATQSPPVTKNKRNTSTLSKVSANYQTGEQAATSRQQLRK